MSNRQMRRDNKQLLAKAQADGFMFGALFLTKLFACQNSEPNDMWCSVLTDVTEKQAKQFVESSAKYGVHTMLL